jgi:hypothetical protein
MSVTYLALKVIDSPTKTFGYITGDKVEKANWHRIHYVIKCIGKAGLKSD